MKVEGGSQLHQKHQKHQLLDDKYQLTFGKITDKPSVGNSNVCNTNVRKQHEVYWAGSSYHCRNCKKYGDRFYMTKETYCKGWNTKE